MSAAKWTPGPWWMHPRRVGVVVNSDRDICVVGDMVHGVSEPDARLIAAAPDMAEALEGALAMALRISRDADCAEVVAIKAALAKARGEEVGP